MRPSVIPEAIHLCPGCGGVCSGDEFCASCRGLHSTLEAKYHAARANRLFSSQQRENGILPEDHPDLPLLRWVLIGIILASAGLWAWNACHAVLALGALLGRVLSH